MGNDHNAQLQVHLTTISRQTNALLETVVGYLDRVGRGETSEAQKVDKQPGKARVISVQARIAILNRL
jgi:hypothetical protein